MKPIIIIITFTVALGCANAQERLFYADKSYESLTTDTQGNLYLVSGASLDLYSPDGKRHLNYSDPTWGSITRVDAGIASKILVFYRESGTIMLLDNELSPVGSPLNLFEKSMMTVSLAAMGNPNKIVLYDEANQELIITDLSLNPVGRTHVAFPGEFHPTEMQVVPEHRIALLDTLRGICLFDFYGTFEREIPIPGITAMQLMKDRLFYLQGGRLWRYTLPTEYIPMSIEPMDIKMPDTKRFRIQQNVIYYIDSRKTVWKED